MPRIAKRLLKRGLLIRVDFADLQAACAAARPACRDTGAISGTARTTAPRNPPAPGKSRRLEYMGLEGLWHPARRALRAVQTCDLQRAHFGSSCEPVGGHANQGMARRAGDDDRLHDDSREKGHGSGELGPDTASFNRGRPRSRTWPLEWRPHHRPVRAGHRGQRAHGISGLLQDPRRRRGAAADDIKKSYRRLARKYHPDVSKEKDAEARFKEVQEAYEVLKDPEKRAAYDQLGSNWQQGQQFRPPPDWAQRL